MSIPAIGSNNSAIYTTALSSSSAVNSVKQDSDGDNDGSRAPSAVGGGGKFASAINDALSQLGVTPTSASSDSDASGTATTQDPQQALASFMQSLFAALQGQSGAQGNASTNAAAAGSPAVGAATNGTPPANTNSVTGTSGEGHHHHHGHGGGMGKLEGGLQNLIQQLSSSSQGASGSSTSDSSSSSSSTLDALQQSFSNLLGADGASGSNVSLTSFLQTLSQGLQGAPATGNVVTTKV